MSKQGYKFGPMSDEHKARISAARKGQPRPENAGKPKNEAHILWGKVNVRGEDECWEWQGFKNEQGYGRTWFGDRGYYAHRVIYNLVYPGRIFLEAPTRTDEKGFLLHTCDNPACCNPKHLWIGTLQDNMDDKVKKGRLPDFSGDKGPRCKLTMDQAREARKLRKQGKPVRELSILFGISLPSMKSLLNGKSYKEAV